jgi:quinol monooxygenase YgiN
MYVVTVQFDIAPAHIDAFTAEILQNARSSRALEPGCRQFDLCIAPDDPARIFLYERYDDRAAFDAHVATGHYKRFDATVSGWVVDKQVRIFSLIDPST